MGLWDGFGGNLVAAILSSGITAGVTYAIYRRGEQKAANQERAELEAAMWRSVEPLYQDLGALHHKAISQEYDEVMKQLGVISERQRRGEYDLSRTPRSMQDFWQAIFAFFENYRLNAVHPRFQDANVRMFMNAEINSFAQLVQGALKGLKATGCATRKR